MASTRKQIGELTRRGLAAFRRVGTGPLLGGLWLSRRFDGPGPVYWMGGFPPPTIAKQRGGRIRAESVALFSGVRIEVGRGATLRLGKGTYLERNTKIVCHEQVTIGRGCQISWDVVIMDSDQHQRIGLGDAVAPVSIGNDVWIGCRALILKGVSIGDGAVIGAGAIVTRDIPAYALAVGQPARVVRMLREPDDAPPSLEARG